MSGIENRGPRIESSEGINKQNELQAVLGKFQGLTISISL